ncbi:MAG: HK97 gp10 family phage protein [Cytophagaceae bacterium]|nr:MAG: HK97 gp10 family phage protein [Cytophagaceae bacterium]
MSGDSDAARVQEQLTALGRNVDKKTKTILMKNAKSAVAEMRRDVPVDTGKLRDSIQIVETKDGVTIQAKAPHAFFVEHGTYKMPARPFFEPAMQTMRAANKRDLPSIAKDKK